jgi:hypothetical protein
MTFTKKGQIMHGKTVPFYFSEKLKNWIFTQLRGKISH